nr:hypothetical protein [Candidatus Freyarchaeota archaeon]
MLRRSGECVIHRNYEKSEIDENLISGFLSAAFSFGSKIGGSTIECLVLKDKKFVFRAINNLIFGAYTDIDDPIEDKLEIISNEFIETYGNLEDWDRDRDRFVDFLPKLDKIFEALGREAPNTLLNKFIQKIQTGKNLEIKESLDEWIKSLKEKAKKTIM